MTTAPVDLAGLYTLLSSPVFAGAFLTFFISHLPTIKNPSRANWLKFLLAVVVCLVWAFLVNLLGPNGLPTTPNGWYALLVMGLAVAMGNALFYQIVNAIPLLRDFVLQVFSKNAPPALPTGEVPQPPVVQS